MTHGQRILLAQAIAARWGGKPLGEPPEWVWRPAGVQAWRDIAAAAPWLCSLDAMTLAHAAQLVGIWRTEGGDRELLRLIYRWLGDLLVAMPDRRRLLFGDSARRRVPR